MTDRPKSGVPLRPAPMQAEANGPLRGLRIIDLTHAAAGPYGSMMLADLGADVIKVEPPRGELVRFAQPFLEGDTERGYGGRFASRNRNKRSIMLDLSVDDDRETFLALVESADGLLENMRSGVTDRLGVGWEVCHLRNPRLVYAAIRGFGDPRTGASPYVDWPAYDVIAQAMGGLVATTGPDAEHPMRAGTVIGDVVPGLMAALGLVSAILHARETGEGQFVDVAMVDGVMSICEPAHTIFEYRGYDQTPNGNSVEDVIPFDIYPTADGQCAIAAPTERAWRKLCGLLDRPDLIEDERTARNSARLTHRDVVNEAIVAWTSQRSTAEVVVALGGSVPVGPVHRASDWLTEPHVFARDMLVEVAHPHHRATNQIGCPIKLTKTPSGIYRRPPFLDEHGDELRAELGIYQPKDG